MGKLVPLHAMKVVDGDKQSGNYTSHICSGTDSIQGSVSSTVSMAALENKIRHVAATNTEISGSVFNVFFSEFQVKTDLRSLT